LLLLPAAGLEPLFSGLDLEKLQNSIWRNKASTTNHPLAEYLKNDYFLTHGTKEP
jgi:hypothetical protein